MREQVFSCDPSTKISFFYVPSLSSMKKKKKNKILPEIEAVDTMGAEAELSTS